MSGCGVGYEEGIIKAATSHRRIIREIDQRQRRQRDMTERAERTSDPEQYHDQVGEIPRR